jgi:hypothetical protein
VEKFIDLESLFFIPRIIGKIEIEKLESYREAKSRAIFT